MFEHLAELFFWGKSFYALRKYSSGVNSVNFTYFLGDCSRGGDAATTGLLPARGAGVRDLCAPPQPRPICDGLQRRQASPLRHEAGQHQYLGYPATLCIYIN